MINENQPNNEKNESQPEALAETRPQVASLPESDPQGTDDINSTQPGKAAKKPSRGAHVRSGFLISLLVLVAALGLGGFAGYDTGVAERVSAQSTLVASQLGDQFSLVQQDMTAGRYSVARQRLEFIIGQDPSFPGASEKLAEILVKQAITPSPVPTETPTLTPTPDTRNQEAVFAQSQQQMTSKDWTNLMGSLDTLRKTDPAYKTAIVDSMYYTALRNRGMDQILGTGTYKTTNLEGGIYDLTLAERFGPLDGQADGLRSFARMYITAASFWSVDWPRAVDYFRQVVQFAPNLRDSSNVTASQRLYQALLQYGDQIAGVGGKSKDQCKALDLWKEASGIQALNNDYQYKYDQLDNTCNPITPTPNSPTP